MQPTIKCNHVLMISSFLSQLVSGDVINKDIYNHIVEIVNCGKRKQKVEHD